MSSTDKNVDIQLHNDTQNNVDFSVGCRRESHVMFADSGILEPNGVESYDELPSTPFELGIKTESGLSNGRNYNNGHIDSIQIYIKDNQIIIEDVGSKNNTHNNQPTQQPPANNQPAQHSVNDQPPQQPANNNRAINNQSPQQPVNNQSPQQPVNNNRAINNQSAQQPVNNQPSPNSSGNKNKFKVDEENQNSLILPLITGLVITKVLLFIPVIHLVAGIVGGFVASYMYDGGPIGGLKIGLLKGVIIFIPLLLLSSVLAPFLSDIPVIGEYLVNSAFLFAGLLSIFIAIKGMIGGVIAGTLAQAAS